MNPILRWIAGIALHWFYGEVRVRNQERIPRTGPVIVAVNHQNALVDAILAQVAVPRRLRITAKASLTNSLPGAIMVKAVGIIPLRRAADERARGKVDPTRNTAAFERITDALRQGETVLMFPEGKSHNTGEMAPLKTGLARAALEARDAGVRGITIIPLGISFEAKATPGTAAEAAVGEPIEVDAWTGGISDLTRALEERLRRVSFLPVAPAEADAVRPSALVRLAAGWGRVTHHLPVALARRMALRSSEGEDEPAMYTMTYGLGLVLAMYVVVAIVAWLLAGPLVAAALVLALGAGAYWAAYAEHPRGGRAAAGTITA